MIPEWVVVIYVVVGGLLFFMSALNTIFESGKSARISARLVIISPVWPVLIVMGLAIVLGKLWKAADWRHKK